MRRQVFAEVDGDVVDVLVKHGERVNKGEVLARMQNIDLNVKIQQMQGQLDVAREQLANTNTPHERSEDRRQRQRTGCAASKAKFAEEQEELRVAAQTAQTQARAS